MTACAKSPGSYSAHQAEIDLRYSCSLCGARPGRCSECGRWFPRGAEVWCSSAGHSCESCPGCRAG